MLLNHFIIAWRNLRKHKGYSFINIFGLTVGLCACLIIATVVVDDLSYDRQWSRSNDLYRILSIQKIGDGFNHQDASSFLGLGPALKKNFPGVEESSPINIYPLQLKFSEADPNGVSLSALHADTSIWKMLDIKVLSGDPRHFVQGQNNLLISEPIRDKYFRGIDPVGKIIYSVPSFGDKPEPYLITGVIRHLPSNTHLRSEIIALQTPKTETLGHNLGGTLATQYLLMKPGVDMKSFAGKVNNWYKQYANDNFQFQIGFQPMKDIYLHSDFDDQLKVKGSIRNIYIFSGIALLLLLIACINFINLSTARSITRLQETGVRKILGADKRHIIFQFLTESMLFFMISAVLAIIFYQPALHSVEHFIGHTLNETFLSHLSLLLLVIAIVFLISLFVGIYPAWLLADFKPSNALQGRLFSSRYSGQNGLRKILVVVQFSISVIVLMSMIIVQQQVRFMNNMDLGFKKTDLLSIGSISWEKKGSAFKNEVLRLPGVEHASISGWTPSVGSGFMYRQADDPGNKGNKIGVWYISGDVDLPLTLGLHLKSGRWLNRELKTDMFEDFKDTLCTQHTLITASTARILHIDKLNFPSSSAFSTPVGIINDFHNESLKQPMGPTLILAEEAPDYGGMLVRVKSGSEKQVMAVLSRIFKQFYPGKLLELNWVDQQLDTQYVAEQKLQEMFAFFSLLSMILASLGIFGLIVHACSVRVKEIGVRKVLGAGIGSIVGLLSSDFIRLVCIAFFIASPVAWWFMHKWLQDFAYRIEISWWMFALTAGVTLLIASVTVGIQSMKAAMANPADSLRSE